MKTLMEKAELLPHTFESDHGNNVFTIRLLLHHFLNEDNIKWLSGFKHYELTEGQKRALIFIREAGAIDNSTYRQLNGFDILRTSGELRALRDKDLLLQKGKGRTTYYVPNPDTHEWEIKNSIAHLGPLPFQTESHTHHAGHIASNNKPVQLALPNQLHELTEPVPDFLSNQFPEEIQEKLNKIGLRNNNKEEMMNIVLALCSWREFSLSELSEILKRREKHLLYNYITPLKKSGKLEYIHPEMPNHPKQAYKTVKAKLSTPPYPKG